MVGAAGQVHIHRSRAAYGVLFVSTVSLGVASRLYGSVLPAFVARYAGDVLWASMVVWLLALLWPRASTRRVALGAFLTAVVVEVSQLYHAPWLDAARATRAGALLLGQGFLWSDLVCYTLGVSAAALLDLWVVRRTVPAGAHAT